MENKCTVNDNSNWSLDDLRLLLAQGVCYLLTNITGKIMAKSDKNSQQDILNKQVGMNLQLMAVLHSAYYTFNSFREAIVVEKDERIRLILETLCKLFGTNMVLTHCGTIAAGQFVKKEQIGSLKALKE